MGDRGLVRHRRGVGEGPGGARRDGHSFRTPGDVSVILPGYVKTAIAINAMTASGSARGRSDANIEAGMPADKAAGIILDGLAAKQREIVVADTTVRDALGLRANDPEALFSYMAKEGARLAALREQEGPNFSPDPAKTDASS
jgi:dehydrogenase/reductase SDR family member 7B